MLRFADIQGDVGFIGRGRDAFFELGQLFERIRLETGKIGIHSVAAHK
jgi:hypothetical protein